MMSRRVLLTGATGLIGRQAINPLKAHGFTVVAMTRGREAVAQADETVVADLLDGDAMKAAVHSVRASHLVHLAWHNDVSDRWDSPKNIDWANATLQLARSFSDAGGRCAVIAGSCAEYDWQRPGPYRESDPLGPSTPYGKAKAATGRLLSKAAEDMGIRLAWARIFFCYGPGEPPGRLAGDLIRGLSAGKTVDCTDGRQERDFLHAADIGRALAILADRDANGAVNIASGCAIPVLTLIETVVRLMERPGLVRLGVLPRPVNDPPRIEADVTRLTTEFGFEPEFDLESGITNVIALDRRG